MRPFSELFDELDSTTSTNEKISALKKYFAQASHDDAMWAVLILTSRISRKVITSRALREIFLHSTGYPEWLFEESYAQVGDTAETLSLLLPTRQSNSTERSLTQWMEVEIPALAKLTDPAARAERMMGYWSQMSPDEIFILNKLMTGGLRVGVSEKLVVRALAEVFDIPSDQISHRLTGADTPGAAAFEALISPDVSPLVFSKPYPFCLAHAWADRSGPQDWDANAWCVEWKYDGIRSQIIRRNQQVWIWSRGEDEITLTFPDVAESFKNLPEGSVVDGEILIIREGRIQAFQDLQKRLGRKKVSAAMLKDQPAAFIAYDCLECDGQDIRQLPLRERKDQLEKLLRPFVNDRLRISPILTSSNLANLADLREQARQEDAEGLMIKSWESPYSVGRKTGHWWKYKLDPLTLDAVLLYAQAGTGRRANLYTDYTFALWDDRQPDAETGGRSLIPFAKAYSGLDQSEIDKLDNWIRRHTKEKFGPVRSLEPFHVFEIAFEGIAESKRHKSGIAVRFPRILRWRTDKAAIDADTLGSAFELLKIPESKIVTETSSEVAATSKHDTTLGTEAP